VQSGAAHSGQQRAEWESSGGELGLVQFMLNKCHMGSSQLSSCCPAPRGSPEAWHLAATAQSSPQLLSPLTCVEARGQVEEVVYVTQDKHVSIQVGQPGGTEEGRKGVRGARMHGEPGDKDAFTLTL